MASAERIMWLKVLTMMLLLSAATLSIAFVIPTCNFHPSPVSSSAAATCSTSRASSTAHFSILTSSFTSQHTGVHQRQRRGGFKLYAEQPNEEVKKEEAAAADAQKEEPPAAEDAAEKVAPPRKEMDVDDLLKSPVFLKKKAEMLEKQLEKLAKEKEEADALAAAEWEEWGRQIANLKDEFQTLKARSWNATLSAGEDTKVEVIKNILGVCDNFLRASQAARPETEKEQAIVDYYKGVYESVMETFKELGVTEVKTVGEPFDWNVHEAVMRQPNNDYDEDVVSTEYAPGYVIGDKLLRAAMVAVSAG